MSFTFKIAAICADKYRRQTFIYRTKKIELDEPREDV